MMDYQEVIELIKIERECVNRNNQPFGMNCDRECGKCDLLQNADDLIEMYNDILEWLEELKELRSRNIEADCPLYYCNNDHHCDSCELMMQFQKEARGLKDEGRESSNVR